MIDMDERDLAAVVKAIDALETLHDTPLESLGGERIRQCLCGEAAAWRGARKVVNHWRTQLGLPIPLLDQV